MKVKFVPQNISLEIKSGQSVMELARENNLPVNSSCNGRATCAECRVYVKEGEARVLPPSAKEADLIGGGIFIDNRRLSCQLFCFGDVTVDLSEQLERNQEGDMIKKRLLKQISKEKDYSSVGGILVEQDQEEINKISLPPEEERRGEQRGGDQRRGEQRRGEQRRGEQRRGDQRDRRKSGRFHQKRRSFKDRRGPRSSEGRRSAHSSEGRRNTHSSEGRRSTHSSEGRRSAHSSEGRRNTHSSEGRRQGWQGSDRRGNNRQGNNWHENNRHKNNKNFR